MTSNALKPPLQPLQYVANGKYPDAAYASDVVAHMNLLASYRLREIARCGSSVPDAYYGVSYHVPFRLSPYANSIMVVGVVAQIDGSLSVPGEDPRVDFDVYTGKEAGGTPVIKIATTTMSGGFVDTAGETNEMRAWNHHIRIMVEPGTNNLADLPTSEWLYLEVSGVGGARLITASVFEHRMGTAPFDEGHAVNTPILDTDRSALVTAANWIWKTGNNIFSWNAKAARQNAGAAKNLIDNTSTTVSTATPGFTVDLRYKSTVRRGTVPCRFMTYGNSAGSGSVYLKDSSGTTLATISGIATEGWYSVDVNLPATLAKYDIWYSDASAIHDCKAVALLQYEA